MAEVVNRLYSKQSKIKAKWAVSHCLKESGCYDDCPVNYRTSFVNYVTHVSNNRDRFSNCLVDQAERGVPHKDIVFVTKEGLISYFNEIMEDATNKTSS